MYDPFSTNMDGEWGLVLGIISLITMQTISLYIKGSIKVHLKVKFHIRDEWERERERGREGERERWRKWERAGDEDDLSPNHGWWVSREEPKRLKISLKGLSSISMNGDHRKLVKNEKEKCTIPPISLVGKRGWNSQSSATMNVQETNNKRN